LARQSAHSLIMLLLHLSVIGPAVTWVIARDGQTWVDRVCGMGNLDVRAGRTDAGAPAYSSSFPPRLPRPRLGLGPHLRSFREWIPPHLPRHISGQGRALRSPKFLLPSLLL